MRKIETLEALHALYGTPGSASLRKVVAKLTPQYRRWIMSSRFCMLATVGPEGVDVSPRGDEGPVVTELDQHHVMMPDWRGNNRLDSLRNIVRDPRVSLIFMVPGSNTAIRLIGQGIVSDDPDLRASFDRSGKQPISVIVVRIDEIYSQCARALIRSGLWTGGDQSAGLPTPGDLLAEGSGGQEGGKLYDDAWPARAARTMW